MLSRLLIYFTVHFPQVSDVTFYSSALTYLTRPTPSGCICVGVDGKVSFFCVARSCPIAHAWDSFIQLSASGPSGPSYALAVVNSAAVHRGAGMILNQCFRFLHQCTRVPFPPVLANTCYEHFGLVSFMSPNPRFRE